MKLLKKYHFYFICFGVIVLYAVTRLYALTQLPLFTDEAIYIRWAQIAANDAAWRFISLTDGKQPSFIWAAMVAVKIFPDPLFAGRIVSVVAGFLSVIGLFFVGKELFKNKYIGVIASFLYVLFPFALVHDRMALYDSMVTTFAVWALYFQVLLVKKLRLDVALILGMILGGGLLTKSSSLFNLALSPALLLLFDFGKKDLKKRLIRWVVLVGVAAIVAFGMYGILRLSPFYYIIGQKNATFVYPLTEWVQHPFTYLFSNLKQLFEWLVVYLTVPTIIVLGVGMILSYKKFGREKLLLLLWFGIPFIYLALFGKIIYPRHILFMTVPIVLLVAYSLFVLCSIPKRLYIKIALFIFAIFWMAYTDFLILTNFSTAPIARSDMQQYVNGWSAGHGVAESVVFFDREAQKGKIFIATQGTFGLLPYAYEIFLGKNPNVVVKGYWPLKEEIPQEIVEKSKHMPTFVVFYQNCIDCAYAGAAPKSWPVEKIMSFRQGNSNDYFTVYRIK